MGVGGLTVGYAALRIIGDWSQADKDIQNFEGKMTPALSRISKQAGLAMTAMGAAITGALGLAAKEAMNFSGGMAKVATLGVKDMAALEEGVKQLAMTYGEDLNEATETLYQTLSAGIPEDAAIMVMDAAARGAQAGQSSLNEALDLGTSVMNAWNLQGKDANETTRNFEQIMGEAATAVKLGKTTIADMASSIGQVAPLMSTAGVSTKEFFSAVSALTASGLPASAAMTQLKATVQAVIAPTSDAEKTAKALGLEFNAAALESKGLAGFLADVKEKTGGNIETMSSLFTSVEALGGVLSLTGNQAGKFKESIEGMSKAQQNLTEMSEAYQKGNYDLAWRKLQETMKVLAVDIGQALLPSLMKLGDWLQQHLKDLHEWIGAHPILTKAIVIITGVIGVLMGLLGPLLIALPGLAIAFGSVGGAAGGAAGMAGIGAVVAGLLGTGGLIVAVGWAAAAIWNMVDAFGKLNKAQKEWDSINAASVRATNDIRAALKEVGVVVDENRIKMLSAGQQQEVLTNIGIEATRRQEQGLSLMGAEAEAAYTKIIDGAIASKDENIISAEASWSAWDIFFKSVWDAYTWLAKLTPLGAVLGYEKGGVVGLPGYATGGEVGKDLQAFRWNEQGGEIAVMPIGTRILPHTEAVTVARDAIAQAAGGGMGGRDGGRGQGGRGAVTINGPVLNVERVDASNPMDMQRFYRESGEALERVLA